MVVLAIIQQKQKGSYYGNYRNWECVFRKKLSREKMMEYLSNLQPCLIGIEACGGANFFARRFKELGHEVRIIAPQFVKPFVKSNKNDAADAEAIYEAMMRPSMRFVQPKSIEQQDIQSLHRVRSEELRNELHFVMKYEVCSVSMELYYRTSTLKTRRGQGCNKPTN